MTNRTKYQKKKTFDVVVSSTVKDYGNEPFFIKKANESKQVLEKHGFPEALKKA